MLIASCAFADHASNIKTTLKLFNWEDYISPEILTVWEQRTGIPVEVIYYDSEKVRDSIMYAHDTMGIDLVILNTAAVKLFAQTNHIRDLDTATLSGYQHHRESWREQCGTRAVPFLWGTLGLVYRSDKFDKIPDSWRDLMQPNEKTSGHIGMLDDYIDAFAPALFLANTSILTDDETQLRNAFNVLREQSQHVLTYDYVLSFLQTNVNADQLYLALAFSGDETSLNEATGAKNRWQYVVPKEGTAVWLDCIAILSNAAHPKVARDFIAFLNEPEIAAMNAEWNGNATPHSAAEALLSDDFKAQAQQELHRIPTQQIQHYGPLDEANTLLRERILQSIINSQIAPQQSNNDPTTRLMTER